MLHALLKFPTVKFWGYDFQIFVKREIVNYVLLKRGPRLVNWLLFICLKWDPCKLQERYEKGVSTAAHPHTLFKVNVPAPIERQNFGLITPKSDI